MTEDTKNRFAMLVRAILAGDVALLECKDRATGESRAVICALDHQGARDNPETPVQFIPLACMAHAHPGNLWEPPSIDELRIENIPACGEPEPTRVGEPIAAANDSVLVHGTGTMQ